MGPVAVPQIQDSSLQAGGTTVLPRCSGPLSLTHLDEQVQGPGSLTTTTIVRAGAKYAGSKMASPLWSLVPNIQGR
jgi:hypothetical protein